VIEQAYTVRSDLGDDAVVIRAVSSRDLREQLHGLGWRQRVEVRYSDDTWNTIPHTRHLLVSPTDTQLPTDRDLR